MITIEKVRTIPEVGRPSEILYDRKREEPEQPKEDINSDFHKLLMNECNKLGMTVRKFR